MDESKEVKEAISALGIGEEKALEFELFSITETSELPRQIARKVRDRLDVYAGMMEFIIQPDQTVSSMNEYSFFNEEEHKKIVQLYRKLMSALRAYSVADLQATKESFMQYTTHSFLVWDNVKDEIFVIVKKLQSGWDREEPLHVERGYLG